MTSYKAILLGETNAGKTAIYNYLTQDKNDLEPTIAITIKEIKIKEKTIKLWDTGGNYIFDEFVSLYYKDADIIIIVYDINDEKSYTKAKFWLNKFSDNRKKKIETYKKTTEILGKHILLVANKIDKCLNNQTFRIDFEKEQELKKKNITYIQISTQSFINIDKLTNNIERIIDILNKKEKPIKKQKVIQKDHKCYH